MDDYIGIIFFCIVFTFFTSGLIIGYYIGKRRTTPQFLNDLREQFILMIRDVYLTGYGFLEVKRLPPTKIRKTTEREKENGKETD